MLKGSEKRNVIPPEASAEIDCRVLAGDDPEEIVQWVRTAIADEHVAVDVVSPPKVPNMSPPDTELYKSLAAALRRRAADTVVAPRILTGFTDNWVFRGAGLEAYGFSPIVVGDEDGRRVHGNDERISLENIRLGTRLYTETLLEMAAA
jgi:acetylornithine deacetylase/succinyl-diaminopimelate desuccinylase-like protein